MTKKTPTRTCIACGESGDKRSFTRIVRTPEGTVVCDAGGKLAGRGAYLCTNLACFDKAVKGRMLDARLRCRVSAGDYERLKDEFRVIVQSAAQAQ